MANNSANKFFVTAMSLLLLLVVQTSAFAQGRGHGGGGSRGGPPPGAGVDRGMGRSSDSVGRGNASERSNGRSDADLDRARRASENLKQADNDLRNHPGIANSLHTTANDLRSGFQAALLKNPNLTFGQFVAATRLAHNLGGRNPNITRDAILAGLASGKSIGQTLHSLGLGKDEAKAAIKQADRETKESKHGS